MSGEITIGGARIRQLTELARWPFAAEDLFPNATVQQVEAAAKEFGSKYVDENTRELILAIHTYVVQLGGDTIVVDTGNGNGRERPHLLAHHMLQTAYLELMQAAVDVRDVSVVINTHLHPDHCGWNTQLKDDVWSPTFPQATYVFAEAELATLEKIVTDGPDNGVEEDLVRMFDDSIRPVLDGSSYETFSGERVLAEHDGTSVVAVTSPGHTVGHTSIEVRSAEASAVMSGDIIHHPIQLTNPQLSQGGDSVPETARRTRTDLLARCAAEGLTLLPSHFPIDGPVRIGSDGNLLDGHHKAARAS